VLAGLWFGCEIYENSVIFSDVESVFFILIDIQFCSLYIMIFQTGSKKITKDS